MSLFLQIMICIWIIFTVSVILAYSVLVANKNFTGLINVINKVDYFIYSKIIRDIKKYDFIEDHFNKNWLDSCGRG